MLDRQPSKVLAAAAASDLWSQYGFSSPDDLVLEDLALALGIVVIEGPLDGAEARLIRKANRGIIRVRENILEPGRKRFAVAHDIGHWELHEKISQLLACTTDDMIAKYKASVAEVEANYFASELLMPEKLFAPLIRNKRLSSDLVRSLASYFQTSLTASAIRHAELSDEPCAVVVSEGRRIRWWRGSDDFKSRFWLQSGQQLSRSSVAAAFFEGRPVPLGAQELATNVWLESESDREAILEEVISMPRYGQVLSLLTLV